METFDWHFNAATIKRALIEELASCAFVRRHENIIVVGQSGLGKSHIFRGIGRCACVHGFRTCYITSAKLIRDLKKTLADDTLTTRLRYWTNFDLLIIDEFGFDRLERQLCSEAPQLLYKVIEGRYAQRSTIIVTNVDFEAWGDYLGDAPLAMAFLDRLVDGANVLKLRGRSYRAAHARIWNATRNRTSQPRSDTRTSADCPDRQSCILPPINARHTSANPSQAATDTMADGRERTGSILDAR